VAILNYTATHGVVCQENQSPRYAHESAAPVHTTMVWIRLVQLLNPTESRVEVAGSRAREHAYGDCVLKPEENLQSLPYREEVASVPTNCRAPWAKRIR